MMRVARIIKIELILFILKSNLYFSQIFKYLLRPLKFHKWHFLFFIEKDKTKINKVCMFLVSVPGLDDNNNLDPEENNWTWRNKNSHNLVHHGPNWFWGIQMIQTLLNIKPQHYLHQSTNIDC